MILGEVLLSLIIFLVLSAFGLRLLKWAGLAKVANLSSFLFGWAIGLGFTAILTLFLGLARLLYPTIAWIVFLALLGVSYKEVVELLKSFFNWIRTVRAREFSSFLMVMVAVLAGLFNLVSALSPPVFYDTLTAHLAHSNWSIMNHAIQFRPYNVYTNYPLNVEAVYTFSMLLLDGDQIAKLINLLFGITSALVVFSIGRRFVNRRAAAIGSIVFYLVPSVGILSGMATHDLGLLLFEITSIFALFMWFNEKESKWLFLSAVLCGFAMGTKYTGLYFFVACLLLVLLRLALDKRGLALILKSVIFFGIFALLVSSPWFIKSLIYTGNPVYPALSNIFGVGEYQKVSIGFTSGKTALHPVHFLRLPWDMTFRPKNFGSASQIGPLFLIFLIPFLFVRKVNRDVRYLLGFAAILFFFWAATIINTRYYLAGIALLSLWIGYCCDRYLRKRLLAWVIWPIVGASLLYNIVFTLNLTTDLFDPGAVVFGRETKEEYLTERLEHYPVIQFANASLPGDAKVLFVGEARTYYMKRNYEANSAYDKTIIVEMIKRSETVDDLLTQLKQEGITDILYNSREAYRLNEMFDYFNWDNSEQKKLFDLFTAKHLKVLFKHEDSYLLHIQY